MKEYGEVEEGRKVRVISSVGNFASEVDVLISFTVMVGSRSED